VGEEDENYINRQMQKFRHISLASPTQLFTNCNSIFGKFETFQKNFLYQQIRTKILKLKNYIVFFQLLKMPVLELFKNKACSKCCTVIALMNELSIPYKITIVDYFKGDRLKEEQVKVLN